MGLLGAREYSALQTEWMAWGLEPCLPYHKVSQLVNPDWVGKGDKEDTTHHFQFLRKVYSIVRDKD